MQTRFKEVIMKRFVDTSSKSIVNYVHIILHTMELQKNLMRRMDICLPIAYTHAFPYG